MEGISIFLESSTIHGLTYISTTRRYARLFWILVVITGFMGSGYIIKESFDFWSESPVETTIETLPITEIQLSKMTVCPPKNTFTDLNYDLMMTENKTLSEQMRDEMFKYAIEVIEDGDNFDEDNFYNWYHGYTRITSPFYNEYNFGIHNYIDTAATSGVVTTQNYGEHFMPELVETDLHYRVLVHSPESVMDNNNMTLHFKMEKVSMTGGTWDRVWYFDNGYLDADQSTTYTNFTPPGSNRSMFLHRRVSTEDVETQKLDLMPGFNLSWWYSGAEVTPDKKYKNEGNTKQFVR